jgi:transposase
MLDQATRTAILKLHAEEHGSRAIARVLRISRGAVREVLTSQSAEVPRLTRTEKADPFLNEIRTRYATRKGNLVLVHEDLVAQGADISYQALTSFCRRHGIGHEPRPPAGRYHFAPGEEMQHDTSPHQVKIGGVARMAQCASLVCGYSRMLFIQYYPTFNRFTCKVFLTDALEYFGGAARRCVIDNTHVVVLHGTGKDMVPVPEMAAFGERFGFVFLAHERGDSNRKSHVEGDFWYVERNFLPGRTFLDWQDINVQARAWSDKANAKFSTRLHTSRCELFAAEKPCLRPLPIHVPEVYVLHQRIVDAEGYICLHRTRYSAPYQLIGRRMEVRETKDRVDIYEGPRQIASHVRLVDQQDARVTDPRHRPPRGYFTQTQALPPDEVEMLRSVPEIEPYLRELRTRRSRQAVRGLARLVRDYPKGPLLAAVCLAKTYGLYDVSRLETLVLRTIAREFFNLQPSTRDEEDDTNGNNG